MLIAPSVSRSRHVDAVETTELHIPRLGRTGWFSRPADASHTVLFVNGGLSTPGRSRHHAIAQGLNARGIATFVVGGRPAGVDAYDIELLTEALIQSARFIADEPVLAPPPFGIFGIGTGAAAALIASLALGTRIGAVVSCSGRPDIADGILRHVAVPTLLIVGGVDAALVELNRCVFALLGCDKDIEAVAQADGAFAGSAALDTVVERAVDWFDLHLPRRQRAAAVGNR